MDERMRRQWAATEASTRGWGGVTIVAEATGLAWNTIRAGMRELDHRAAHPDEPVEDRIRCRGAGRKRLTETDIKMEDIKMCACHKNREFNRLIPLNFISPRRNAAAHIFMCNDA